MLSYLLLVLSSPKRLRLLENHSISDAPTSLNHICNSHREKVDAHSWITDGECELSTPEEIEMGKGQRDCRKV